MATLRRDTLRHTYADYLTWSDTRSGELIDGVAYLREPPAPSRVHQEIVGQLHLQVGAALEGRSARAYVAPFDVRLPKAGEADEQIDTVVQPDVLIVCDRNKLDERGMRGAPDWVAEVLSAAKARHDETVKVAAYERAGVPEVWLVHPTDRRLRVYRLEGGRYDRPVVMELTGRTPIGAVPSVAIDWERVVAALE